MPHRQGKTAQKGAVTGREQNCRLLSGRFFYKLKKVVIPPRPFIKNAWEANEGKYKQLVFDGLKDICNGDTTAMKLLNKLGNICVRDIQESAVKLKNPPNAPLTVENKGSSNPLVDTGEMIRKVTYKIIPT